MSIQDFGARELASAIILQAVEDYQRAVVDNHSVMIADCERFFKSKWFETLSGDLDVSGETVMNTVRKKALEFDKLSRQHLKNGEAENVFKCPICGGEVDIQIRYIPRGKYRMRKAVCGTCSFYVWDDEKIKK